MASMNVPTGASGLRRSLYTTLDRNGRVDFAKYHSYRSQNKALSENNRTNLFVVPIEEEIDDNDPPLKKQRTRSCKKIPLMYRDQNGDLQVLTPSMSPWFLYYCSQPDLTSPKFHKKFRRRFRVPYHSFLELLLLIKESELFERWQSQDAAGVPSSPIELLLLGSLRYLGRGWTFDDLEESTAIDEETHRQFFHTFITWGSTVFYDLHVVAPSTKDEIAFTMRLYALAGLNGCLGSGDATHVGMEKCSHYLAQAHKAAKLPLPARTYNLIASHTRRILSSTRGHPARWNDKTLQMFDVLMKETNNGKRYSDTTFCLFEKDSSGTVVEANYSGVWFLVDNGYVNWSTTIPPLKQPLTRAETRWSEWMESMRKDVECTFGILKGRFRILKTGIRLHSIASCDRVWLTCCALHNYLLREDGLEKGWNGQSIWTGELGEHDPSDRFFHPAFSRASIMNPTDFPRYDPSGMGRGNDRVEYVDSDDDDSVEETCNGDGGTGGNANLTYPPGDQTVRVVRNLCFAYFRERLIEHFDIMFKRDKLVWPSRDTESPKKA